MSKDTAQVLSTFDQAMQDPERKKAFNEGYQEFLLSELYLAIMEEDTQDTSTLLTDLAKEGGVSPHKVPYLTPAKKQNVLFLKNFFNLLDGLGYKIVIKKGRRQIPFIKE